MGLPVKAEGPTGMKAMPEILVGPSALRAVTAIMIVVKFKTSPNAAATIVTARSVKRLWALTAWIKERRS